MKRRSNARIVCRWCDRVVSAHPPKRGDGTALMAFKHRNENGTFCEGSYDVVNAWGSHVMRHFWQRPRGI